MGDLEESEVLGVRFVAEPFPTVLDAVLEELSKPRTGRAGYLCPTGVHGVIEARRDSRLRDILNQAMFNVPDGMPIVMASRALGHDRAERVFGPDVMWAVLRDSVSLGTRHFFYGGREGVADRLAERVTASFPGIAISGTYCPPFRPLTPEEEDAIVRRINDSRTDVVWVGLSTPKQEHWIASMRDRLDVRLMCSVGAAFDYHTGSIRSAPEWMKRSSLEWFYRLLQEPRRLWRRYLDIVPSFLVLIGLQLLGLKDFSSDEGAKDALASGQLRRSDGSTGKQ